MDEILPRLINQRLIEASNAFPVVLLLGARQTGKTTLIQSVFESRAKTYTFDPVQDLYLARKDPDFFLDQIGYPVFLDEVQYAPEVLSAIKRRVDEHRKPGMYYLSGTQNFSVMKAMKESLAGRVFIQDLNPLSQREMNRALGLPAFISSWLESKGQLNLNTFPEKLPNKNSGDQTIVEKIWRGGFPGILKVSNSLLPGYFQSYIQTYIERDIRSLADIHSYQEFGRFMQILSARTAREINESELGRELGISRKTAMAWKDLAIHSYMWKEVPGFSGNTTKRIVEKKKGYFIDSGIVCSFLKFPSPESLIGHPEFGFIFESFVFMEIWKTLQSLPLFPGIYHYRTNGGAEVDLILEFGGTYFPIEIKSSSSPNGNDARGIESFRKTFNRLSIAPGVVICACQTPYQLNHTTWAVPYGWL